MNRHLSRRIPTVAGLCALLLAGVGVRPVAAQSLPASCTFSNDPVVTGVTVIKAQHITELRACINDLRLLWSLQAVGWTDASLVPQQSVIRAIHITELRATLNSVYSAANASIPQYHDGPTPGVTFVRAVHLNELRTAARNAPRPSSPPPPPPSPPPNPGQDPGGEVSYLHTDGIGSVRVVTNASGNVVARYDYLPFGSEWSTQATITNPIRFGGKERDAETGAGSGFQPLDYFGARYYASQAGRFTTTDPVLDTDRALVDPQGWNRYSYSFNRPLRFGDPDGRNPFAIGAVIIAGAALLLAPDTANAPGPNDPTYPAGGEGGVIASVGSLLLGDLAAAKVTAAAGRLWGAITGRGVTTAVEVEGGAANRAAFEAYKTELRAQMGRPAATDARLNSLLDELYRPNAQVGSGSTAAAVRQELATKQAVGGRFHSQKAADMIKALEKWLRQNPTAMPRDRAAAENVMLDLQNALNGY